MDVAVLHYIERTLSNSLSSPQAGFKNFTLDDSYVSNSLEGSYRTAIEVPPAVDTGDGPLSDSAVAVNEQQSLRIGNNPLFQSRHPQHRTFNITVDSELARSSSGEIVGYKDVYNIPPSMKYLPVDMVVTPSVKKSIARSLLFSALKSGLTVIKHGE